MNDWTFGTGDPICVSDLRMLGDEGWKGDCLGLMLFNDSGLRRPLIVSPHEWNLMVRAEAWRKRTERRASFRGSRKAKRAARLLRGDTWKRWQQKPPSVRRRILRAREEDG